MPSGRLRGAFVSGTITDNPLTVGATSMNSAGLSSLPTVAAPDTAMIVLDPAGVTGVPEVVTVTTHTAAATVATITRAAEGSTARQMVVGTAWVHGPTIYDFLQGPQIVGSNAAEVTTTSTSAVDLLTISNLNIPVTSGIIIEGVVRKSAGGAFNVGIGLKVNSIITAEADSAGGTGQVWHSTANSGAENGGFKVEIMPRSANYLRGAVGMMYNPSPGGNLTLLTSPVGSADFPNATVTSIALRGITGNAAVTLAVKEVVVIEIKYAMGT